MLEVTSEMMTTSLLFPLIDGQSRRLIGGPLQLANGAVLILDFTHFDGLNDLEPAATILGMFAMLVKK